MPGLSDILNLLQYAVPAVLGTAVIVLSLVSSKLAWWISRTFVKSWWKRLGLWFVLWMIVMLIRIGLFFKIWRRGVGPLAQYRAWKQFLALVECFVDEKAGTICFAFITLISNLHDERIKPEEFKIEDIAKKDDGCGLVCYEPLPRFLKVIFTAGDPEQRYLTALFSMIKQVDGNKFWGGLVNGVGDYLRAFDLQDAKKEYIKFAMMFADKIVDFAKGCNDRDLALSAIELKQRVYVLGHLKCSRREAIVELVDDIVSRVNSVSAKVEVAFLFANMSKTARPAGFIPGGGIVNVDVVEDATEQ